MSSRPLCHAAGRRVRAATPLRARRAGSGPVLLFNGRSRFNRSTAAPPCRRLRRLWFNTRVLAESGRDRMEYRELVLYGVYTDLRTEVARRFLGFAWWILEPVMYMAVFYAVFGLGLRQGGPDYVPFLLTGMVAWKWFDGSVRQASNSILANTSLIQQIFVPKYVFGLIQILTNTFKFLLVLLLLLGFLVITGRRPSLEWFGLLPVLLVQFLLIVSLGLLLGAVIPFMHDLKMLVDNALMLMMFMSGIFFDAKSLSGAASTLFRLNPMVPLIEAHRAVLLHNAWPHWGELGYVVLVSLPMLAGALLMLRHFERQYPKLIY